MIKAEILLDSINISNNARITTWVLEYPRFVHSELLTHRMFSKNSASSRAIPFDKFVEQIINNPAMPEFWGKNQSGMQAVEELDDTLKQFPFIDTTTDGEYSESKTKFRTSKEHAKALWLKARDKAIEQAKELNSLGCHKQIVNRLLEPWFHIRIIMTATDMENFFALRAHNMAQPEIAALAYKMLEEYNKSTPQKLKPGEWHIPFSDKIDLTRLINTYSKINNSLSYESNEDINKNLNSLKLKIAVARCARVSYYNFDGKDDYEADIKLCDRLFGASPKHLSPCEHPAMAIDEDKYIGNFKGFKQYRYFFDGQNLKDERILSKI